MSWPAGTRNRVSPVGGCGIYTAIGRIGVAIYQRVESGRRLSTGHPFGSFYFWHGFRIGNWQLGWHFHVITAHHFFVVFGNIYRHTLWSDYTKSVLVSAIRQGRRLLPRDIKLELAFFSVSWTSTRVDMCIGARRSSYPYPMMVYR